MQTRVEIADFENWRAVAEDAAKVLRAGEVVAQDLIQLTAREERERDDIQTASADCSDLLKQKQSLLRKAQVLACCRAKSRGRGQTNRREIGAKRQANRTWTAVCSAGSHCTVG